ncbi:MATE family efflux transporter [uncultured Clostridium sp.]|uniref:MATE family efflux transporter n=1 Tax=uncultured Clostridium sp. TaxID=59620 RepID=UPI0025D40CA7|nr:MATE family efflux transporter [uncultured Clostridium sp.]
MKNILESKTSIPSLIKHTLPTVIMMIFFAMYSIVDGMFVSRYVGANALSSINIVYPMISLLIGISVMLATGGNAIVSRLLGEKKEREAKEGFTLIVVSAVIIGIIIAIISLIFIKPVILFLGATDNLYDYCRNYLAINLLFTPFIILKLLFDYYYVTAGKSAFGLYISVLGGVINMVLDYIFIAVFKMGVSGAAAATVIGYTVPAVIGLFFFADKKNLIHFVKSKFKAEVLKESCINGSSEMVTQLSSAVTTFLYNLAMLKYLGEAGVASITVILYIQFLLSAAYIGFTSGVAPRIGYNYGAQNKKEIHKLVKYSYIIIGGFSIITFIFSKIIEYPLTALFCGKGTEIYYITLNGFNLFSISFLLCGINIFTCGLFTAFSNGKVSGMLSLFRTFIFFIIGLFVLPQFLGVDGVWLIAAFSEVLSLILSAAVLFKYRYAYGYHAGAVNI